MRSFRRVLLAFSLSLVGLLSMSPAGAVGPVDGSSCSSWVRIIDVSSYQPSVNWAQVRNAGIAGVYVKATEGTGYVSPTYGNQKAGAAGAGLPVGAYTYMHPGQDNPVQAVDYFLANSGAGTLTLPPMLDIEQSTSDGPGTATYVAWAVAEVKAKTGRTPVIYMGGYFIAADFMNSAIAPLWLPAYTSGYSHVPGDSACNTSTPSRSGTWSAWSIWQFTSVGQISGIPGNVDVSAVAPSYWSQVTGAGSSSTGVPVYGPGSSGQAVITIQRTLSLVGLYNGAFDGVYGPLTQWGVALWQQKLGVTVDGYWSAQTQAANDRFWAWLSTLPKPAPAVNTGALAFIAACEKTTIFYGQTGSCVKFAQQRLQTRGYPIPADGVYGLKTWQAILAFQSLNKLDYRHSGLAVDGIIGPATWKLLVS